MDTGEILGKLARACAVVLLELIENYRKRISEKLLDRILKVARTLADLAGKPEITGNEVMEAIQFRSLDRQLFE